MYVCVCARERERERGGGREGEGEKRGAELVGINSGGKLHLSSTELLIVSPCLAKAALMESISCSVSRVDGATFVLTSVCPTEDTCRINVR